MTADQAATVAETDNVATLRAMYEAFAIGDIPRVLASLDPDVEGSQAAGGPYAGTFRGPQAVVEGVFARLGADWPGFAVETEEFIAAGDTVAVLATYRGTYQPTARSMQARVVHVWHFNAGRVIRFEQVADTAMLNSVLG
jgi:ketosteroid isomerase-like protein